MKEKPFTHQKKKHTLRRLPQGVSRTRTRYIEYKADIARYFPALEDLLNWVRYCTHLGFPDRFTQRILAQEKVGFAGTLFSSEHNQTFRTEGSVAKLERDPENEHRFILNIDGVSVFQWFRDMARKLLKKLGFKPKEPRRGQSLGR